MLTEIDAAHRHLFRIKAGRAETRVPRQAVQCHRTREGLNRLDRQASGKCMPINALGIIGLEHQPVEPDRKRLDFSTGRAAGPEAEQFQVIGDEHRQMVARAERVMAARRQLKAELRETLRRLVDTVAYVDDDMVEDRCRWWHAPAPR